MDLRLPYEGPYDMAQTASGLAMGRRDPTTRVGDGRAAHALRTPEGPAAFVAVQRDDSVAVRLFGAGAGWLEPRMTGLLGLDDPPEAFRPQDRTMRRLAAARRGMRLVRRPLVVDRVLQVVLLQLVTWVEAFGAWRRLVEGHGEPAPGMPGLVVPPAPEVWASLPDDVYYPAGVLPRQVRTLRRVARRADAIERAAESGAAALEEELLSIPGVGPWTVQSVLGSALAESDALLLGDYNLPHTAAWVLAGEERGDDARLLELFEPYRPHRYRATLLLWTSGLKAPRRAPRQAIRNLAVGR